MEVVSIDQRETQLIKELAREANRLMSDWPPTRKRQKKFVLKYIEGGFGNATEAARQAGYSEKTAKTQANAFLTKLDFSHIQEVVKQFQEIYQEKLTELSILTPTELMQFWTRIILDLEKDTQMIGIGDGAQEVIEVPAAMKDKLRSSELLGKTHSMFTEKLDVTSRNVEIVVGEWDEEESSED